MCSAPKPWCAPWRTNPHDRGAAGPSLAVDAFRRRDCAADAAVPAAGGSLALLAVVRGLDEIPVALLRDCLARPACAGPGHAGRGPVGGSAGGAFAAEDRAAGGARTTHHSGD